MAGRVFRLNDSLCLIFINFLFLHNRWLLDWFLNLRRFAWSFHCLLDYLFFSRWCLLNFGWLDLALLLSLDLPFLCRNRFLLFIFSFIWALWATLITILLAVIRLIRFIISSISVLAFHQGVSVDFIWRIRSILVSFLITSSWLLRHLLTVRISYSFQKVKRALLFGIMGWLLAFVTDFLLSFSLGLLTYQFLLVTDIHFKGKDAALLFVQLINLLFGWA